MVATSSTSTQSRYSPRRGSRNGIGFPVQVEARHRSQADIVLKLRVGLAGEHVHGVPQSYQFTAQVTYVHALAAAEGISSVCQQRHP